MKYRVALFIPDVEVRAQFDQSKYHLHMSLANCEMQRRVASVVILGVDVRA